MPRRRSDLRNRIELVRRRPPSGRAAPRHAGGSRIGRTPPRAGFYRAIDRKRRDLAEENLTRAFPDKRPEEIEALSIAVFEHFGGVAADVLHTFGSSPEALDARVSVSGEERIRAGLASGRGLFLLTAHLGNWEYSALATAAAGFPCTVIARPLDNPLLERLLKSFRERSGNSVVYKTDAAREMLRVLRRGGIVGILADQHARTSDGVVVPFFGRPAATTSIVARLADRTEALIVACRLRPDGPGPLPPLLRAGDRRPISVACGARARSRSRPA